MPIYEYETIPQDLQEKPKRFEVLQHINDAPLQKHPDTGEPVKRVISAFSVGFKSAATNCPSCAKGSCSL